jgi:hypothetical protein
VVEGIAGDFNRLMGIYALLEAKVVNRRAVWQKQGGDEETFLTPQIVRSGSCHDD